MVSLRSGAVYMFRSNDGGLTWSESQKLIDNGAAADDRFGAGLALYSGTLIISSPYSVAGEYSG